jgi:DNA-directed RNA polymerase specialized sigma24 family protein
MKNYDKLVKYASKFVGEHLAKDLVHDVWLRLIENGLDILSENKPNRFLYVTVKNEFILSTKRSKNANIHFSYTELEEDYSIYEPCTLMDSQLFDGVIRNRIECVINDRESLLHPLTGKKRKDPYSASKLLETYNLLISGCSTKEISESIEVPEPTVRNYIKKIKELSGFLKLSSN